MIRHVIFKVISKCNLDCPYCYYITDLEDKWQKRFPIDRLDEFFARYSEYNNDLRVSWHGGEPLLARIDFFQAAIEAAERNYVAIRHSIQTNGMLVDDQWVDFFNRHQFHVGVSIDGPAEIHDRERPTKSKKGPTSHQGAVQAIERLARANGRFGTLTVAHPWADGREVYEHLRGLGVRHMDFLLPIVSEEQTEGFVAGCAQFLLDVFDAWTEENDDGISIRYFTNILRALMGGNAKQCILNNRCDRYITLEPNGDIGLCENIRMVDIDLYQTGKNVFVNSFADIEKEVNRRLLAVHFNNLGEECRNCEYMPVCRGGCPVARHAGDLHFDQPSVYCKLYKTVLYRLNTYVRQEFELARDHAAADSVLV